MNLVIFYSKFVIHFNIHKALCVNIYDFINYNNLQFISTEDKLKYECSLRVFHKESRYGKSIVSPYSLLTVIYMKALYVNIQNYIH